MANHIIWKLTKSKSEKKSDKPRIDVLYFGPNRREAESIFGKERSKGDDVELHFTDNVPSRKRVNPKAQQQSQKRVAQIGMDRAKSEATAQRDGLMKQRADLEAKLQAVAAAIDPPKAKKSRSDS